MFVFFFWGHNTYHVPIILNSEITNVLEWGHDKYCVPLTGRFRN